MKKSTKQLFLKSLSILPDKYFTSLTFFLRHKRFPNIKNPTYFSDKLLYLKLSDRNKIYKTLVDKYEVRKYVEDRIGSQYLIPLIGVYTDPADVDFRTLPSKFALKPTSGSQNNLICKDKSKLDWEKSSKDIRDWLNLDYFSVTREWPYKDLPKRFVIEEYIEDYNKQTIDYKFWCFNGKPEYVQVIRNRSSDLEKNVLNLSMTEEVFISNKSSNIDLPMDKPKNYSLMIDIVKVLSEGFHFVRVDLYNIDGKIYFGEITLYPGNCNNRITPFKYEKILGDKICL